MAQLTPRSPSLCVLPENIEKIGFEGFGHSWLRPSAPESCVKQPLKLLVQRNRCGQIIFIRVVIDGQHFPKRPSIATRALVELEQRFNKMCGGLIKAARAPGEVNPLWANGSEGIDVR